MIFDLCPSFNLFLTGIFYRSNSESCRNQFLFLCSFQGAPGFRPDPFAAALPSPPDRLQQPPVGVGRFSHLGLRFLIFLRTLKTIQTRDFAQPFSLAFQSDALASLSLCLSYINRSYSVSLDSLAVLRTDFSIPIDLRIRTTYSAVHLSLERR